MENHRHWRLIAYPFFRYFKAENDYGVKNSVKRCPFDLHCELDALRFIKEEKFFTILYLERLSN